MPFVDKKYKKMKNKRKSVACSSSEPTYTHPLCGKISQTHLILNIRLSKRLDEKKGNWQKRNGSQHTTITFVPNFQKQMLF